MEAPTQPPVLSTPETLTFEDPTPASFSKDANKPRLTDVEIHEIYEVERTAREIVEGGWKKVALQFPDRMLGDATRVFEGLERELSRLRLQDVGKRRSEEQEEKPEKQTEGGGLEVEFNSLGLQQATNGKENSQLGERIRLYILADTSYGSCCVDEIAAEHVDAEVVVHYGRSCLSPTARLPVIYVFTSHSLDLSTVISTFESTFSSNKEEKIILMADITYHNHIAPLYQALQSVGWTNLLAPSVIHDPSSVIPNRKVPEEIDEEELKTYKLFHISDPPNALVLTLYSRVGQFVVYPTTSTTSSKAHILDSTQMILRRRYALLSHLATVPIIGILINTLSIRSYLSTLSSLTALLQEHGKKHYTFVVGKVNAAKMANFAEIGGWVVVGCWEGSLFDSSTEAGFFTGVVTPFELGLALRGEGWRVRGGEWKGGLEEVLLEETPSSSTPENVAEIPLPKKESQHLEISSDSESESEPPEYDFRTGRYITSSRPMLSKISNAAASNGQKGDGAGNGTLTRRSKNTDLATVNGVLSPGAEFLRSQRTWTGLGSDFGKDGDGEGALVEEGRSGVARGYVIGEEGVRH